MFPINIFLNKCAFGFKLKSQFILLFSLFLQLFMSPTALFGTICGSHYTISANFYLYLQYFQQKVFSFSKISGSQISPISSQFINIDMTTFIEEKQTRMRKHDIRTHYTYPRAAALSFWLFRKTTSSSSKGALKSSNPLLKRYTRAPYNPCSLHNLTTYKEK